MKDNDDHDDDDYRKLQLDLLSIGIAAAKMKQQSNHNNEAFASRIEHLSRHAIKMSKRLRSAEGKARDKVWIQEMGIPFDRAFKAHNEWEQEQEHQVATPTTIHPSDNIEDAATVSDSPEQENTSEYSLLDEDERSLDSAVSQSSDAQNDGPAADHQSLRSPSPKPQQTSPPQPQPQPQPLVGRALSQTKNASFVRQLQCKYEVSIPVCGNEKRFWLGRCDPYTQFNNTLIGVLTGEKTLRDVEAAAKDLGHILEPTMEIAAHAKAVDLAAAKKSNAKKYSFSNVNLSISHTLHAFEKGDKIAQEREVPPIEPAAKNAANDYRNKILGEGDSDVKWKEYARFKPGCKNQVSIATYIVCQIRVYYQVIYDDLIDSCSDEEDRNALKDFRETGESICGEYIGKFDLARIYEVVLVPTTRPNTPRATVLKARKVSEIIKDNMGHLEWLDEYAVAESIPLTETYDSYNKEELAALVEAMILRFFSERGDAKTNKRSYERRTRSSSMLPYLLHSQLVADSLRLPSKDAQEFPLALLCSTPTTFQRTTFDFLLDERLNRENVDETFATNIHKGAAKDMFKRMNTVMEDTCNELIYVDMTDDLRNGTMEEYELVKSYFGSAAGNDGGEDEEEEEEDDEGEGEGDEDGDTNEEDNAQGVPVVPV